MRSKSAIAVIASISTLLLAIVFVINSWAITGVLSGTPAVSAATDNQRPQPDLQQAAGSNDSGPLAKVDTHRCFSGPVYRIDNITDNGWTSTKEWKERYASNCSTASAQDNQILDLSQLALYANDQDGNPRHTEFQLINGTTLSVNEEHIVYHAR